MSVSDAGAPQCTGMNAAWGGSLVTTAVPFLLSLRCHYLRGSIAALPLLWALTYRDISTADARFRARARPLFAVFSASSLLCSTFTAFGKLFSTTPSRQCGTVRLSFRVLLPHAETFAGSTHELRSNPALLRPLIRRFARSIYGASTLWISGFR